MSQNDICPYCGTVNCSNYDAGRDYHEKCPKCSAAIRPDGTCVSNYTCPNSIPIDQRPKPPEVVSVLSDAVIN